MYDVSPDGADSSTKVDLSLQVIRGVRTLRTQDTSDLRQFGNHIWYQIVLLYCDGAKVSLGHFGTSAKCLNIL